MQGTFPVVHGCNLECAAVDAVLDACRAALAKLKGSTDEDKGAIQQSAQEPSRHGMGATNLRRTSILQLRIHERRILNRTVSVLISQRRHMSAQRHAAEGVHIDPYHQTPRWSRGPTKPSKPLS